MDEYLQLTDFKKAFAVQNERLYKTLRKVGIWKFDKLSSEIGSRQQMILLTLMPMVEVAWADGQVTSRETEAILQAAETCGLLKDEIAYCDLMSSLISRPAPARIERSWERWHSLLRYLPGDDRETVIFTTLIQARYIAELSSNRLNDFLRGKHICSDGQSVLEKIMEELKKAELSAAERPDLVAPEIGETFVEIMEPISTPDAEYSKDAPFSTDDEDLDGLLPLVPLVKVAWAEGFVTRRERQVIFDAASRQGVKPGTASYRRLSGWLEFPPSDEFFDKLLERLYGQLQTLSADDKTLKRLDLLSDCTLVAEASGGSLDHYGGGPLICDEEIVAVKDIAHRLKGQNAAAAL